MTWRRAYPKAARYFALTLCLCATSCSKQSFNNVPAELPGKTQGSSFGRRQIDQMLSDRPDMAGILADDDAILRWIIDSMNGDRIAMRIYWNANSPRGGASADHGLPTELYPPYVRVSGGTEITGIDKWACLVYELFNLEQYKDFYASYSKAVEGQIDGSAYATECAKHEFVALKKAKKFFEEHPLPNATPGKNAKYDQLQSVPETFEEHVAMYRGPDGRQYDPGQQFKDYYDQAIAPYIEDRPLSAE